MSTPAAAAPSARLGFWQGPAVPVSTAEMREALYRLADPFFLLKTSGGWAIGRPGEGSIIDAGTDSDPEVLAFAPACKLPNLGDADFQREHGLVYPYIAGAMANGIASEEIVIAMGRAGMLGFFGAAGLPLPRVEQAIDRIQSELGADGEQGRYGSNLIHSPSEPALEEGCVELYLRKGVRLVSASAYLNLTLPLLRYRLAGIHRDGDGKVVAPNHVIAKVSRIEVARRFFAPPPEKMLTRLVDAGHITPDQAAMAREIPVAQDITAEADSGGHTDNQPFVILLPTLIALRDEMQATHGYSVRLRVGAAGGIGTPASAAAAFAMGAAYILTGSVNQACQEAGTSDRVREMLAGARQADCAMAPAADMFEMGVKLQVLKRGTMFAMRAGKLYEFYRAHDSWEAIPAPQRAMLEKDYFHQTFDEVWAQTQAFFTERDPAQLAKAQSNPKHKMALVFRWYLGLSSFWANRGQEDRQVDYQVWCGPAMGAFNEWAKGSFLDDVSERKVVPVALNLLFGAAVLTRQNQLRSQGVQLPAELNRVPPMREDEISKYLG